VSIELLEVRKEDVKVTAQESTLAIGLLQLATAAFVTVRAALRILTAELGHVSRWPQQARHILLRSHPLPAKQIG